MTFQKGQIGHNKGKIFSEDTCRRMSEAKKGKPSTRKGKSYKEIYGEETANKMIKGLKEREFTWNDKISKTRKKLIEEGKIKAWAKGITGEEFKKHYKTGKTWIEGKNYEEYYGKEKADELKKDMGKQNIGRKGWNKDLTKFDHPSIMKYAEKSIFKDLNFQVKYKENIQKGLKRKPSSYEKRLSDLLINNHLPFIYTGDNTFLVGNKNPDFVNKEKRIAIEVFEDYFKIKKYGSVENYENNRRIYFKEHGWDIIFIRTSEIRYKDYEQICLNKINEVLR